jgi:hypothetical protein
MRLTDDFAVILRLLEQHAVRYLIVGGYAFSYHAVPRYTKVLDIWVEPTEANVARANEALADFGSPALLDHEDPKVILQLGVEPNRIDLLLDLGGPGFDAAWDERVRDGYGDVTVNWMGLTSLIGAKALTGRPRDADDAAVLEAVRRTRGER